MAKAERQLVDWPFPVKGVVETTAYAQMLEATSPDARNVRPFDAMSSRLRGGQRPGLSKAFASSPITDRVQNIRQATLPAIISGAEVWTLWDPLALGGSVTDDFSAYADGKFHVVTDANWASFYPGWGSGLSVAAPAVEGGWNTALVTGNRVATHDTQMSAVLKTDVPVATKWRATFDLFDNTYTEHSSFGFAIRTTGAVGSSGYELDALVAITGAELTILTLVLYEYTGAATDTVFLHAGITDPDGNPNVSSTDLKLRIQVDADVLTVWYYSDSVGAWKQAYHGGAPVTATLDNYGDQRRHGITTAGQPNGGSMWLDNYTWESAAAASSERDTRVSVVAGGNVYVTAAAGGNPALATAGAGALDSDKAEIGAVGGPASPSDAAGVAGHRFIYFCDGSAYKRLDVTDGEVVAWTAAAGTLPVDDDGNTCESLAMYRGRIVGCNLYGDPQNWFMSAVNDSRDWDYAPATTSATQAVAGNSCDAGKVADILVCPFAFSDDFMLFGGDHTVWMLTGDPAAGGTMDNVSMTVGVCGPEAIATDGRGVVYFVSRDGLYRLVPGESMECISDEAMSNAFSEFDVTASRVRLAWDPQRNGLHVFVTPLAQAVASHYWWDARTGGFWPDSFPDAVGPTAVAGYDSDAPDDRALLLGGFDGDIRKPDNAAKNDDGTAIDSYAKYTPIQGAGQLGACKLSEMTVVLDEQSDPVDLSVYTADTAEAAVGASTARFTRELSAGRSNRVLNRVRGNTLVLKLGNDTVDETWAIEGVQAVIQPVGRTRGSGSF